ncbi:RHS repeat-associated core domain-containing protein [Streptomyces sp. J15]|uniref:RHS repeat-associated core domain-containing protein n=1 Tax=Streptomyces pakalii TaxID=3036494 RepID=A0ABT7DEN4_9ACTN|nr:RHS repeat-associated core domain-containing protein [Streptomyces pakalii]MDJ1644013.1 RHS repeat-associated core domain-containing protein [Streptomyces pakalii]
MGCRGPTRPGHHARRHRLALHLRPSRAAYGQAPDGRRRRVGRRAGHLHLGRHYALRAVHAHIRVTARGGSHLGPPGTPPRGSDRTCHHVRHPGRRHRVAILRDRHRPGRHASRTRRTGRRDRLVHAEHALGHHDLERGRDDLHPLRFPGQYFDPETGLHYNYFRHYDPENARYLTPDPLGLTPAPNPSSYVPNPLTWSDSTGLAPDMCPTAEAAAERKLKPGEQYVYRAVMDNELGDLLEAGQRRYRNLGGAEVKYFSSTPEGAAAYARQAYQMFGDEGSYTLTRGIIRTDAIRPESYIQHLADAGGKVDTPMALSNDEIAQIGRVRVLPSMPIPQ